jgi:hypothetical protein
LPRRRLPEDMAFTQLLEHEGVKKHGVAIHLDKARLTYVAPGDLLFLCIIACRALMCMCIQSLFIAITISLSMGVSTFKNVLRTLA